MGVYNTEVTELISMIVETSPCEAWDGSAPYWIIELLKEH